MRIILFKNMHKNTKPFCFWNQDIFTQFRNILLYNDTIEYKFTLFCYNSVIEILG